MKNPKDEIKELKWQLKIEAALERVRAKSMSMHESNQLNTIVSTIFKEFEALKLNVHSANIVLNPDKGKDWLSWASVGTVQYPYVHWPYVDLPALNLILEAWKHNKPVKYSHSVKEKGKFWREFFKLGIVPEQRQKMLMEAKGLEVAGRFLNHTGLLALRYNDEEFLQDEIDVIVRFSQVFEQAYTRFLDLQKAEAQVREAQIEVALERIRSRSMSMQRSRELNEVAEVLFRQISVLNIKAHNAWVTLVDSKANTLTMWKTKADSKMQPEPFVNPGSAHPLFQGVIDAWKAGKKVMEIPMPKKVAEKINLEAFDQKLNLPVEAKTYTALEIRHRYGTLGFSTWRSISEDEKAIIQRFAKVFEQTYTRFLDLQKAEGQAREAQIEAALERVRSRSLAMHKSEELADLSFELVRQVQALGVPTWFCAFNIYDNDPKGSIEWGSNGESVFPSYRTPREGIFLRYYKAGQRGESLFVNEIGEKECPGHYEYLCALPGVGEQLLKMKEAGIPFPTSQIDHVAFFKYGYILFITFEPVPETHVIFKRFAKVFEQTYTRFLDLQKAEVQAREAQIEAALERIRSRSMAMHKTEELWNVIDVVFKQFQELDIELDVCYIDIFEKDNWDFHMWIGAGTATYPQIVHLPFIKHPLFTKSRHARENKENFYLLNLDRKSKDKFFTDHFYKHATLKVPKNRKDLIAKAKGLSGSVAVFDNASIVMWNYNGKAYSDEENQILRKVGNVFKQTYTRFLDLQKAEAQAQEAQVEAALERVRSKSMAMHKSEELHSVVNTLYGEFKNLNVEFNVAIIQIKHENPKDLYMWISTDDGSYKDFIHWPYIDMPIFNEVYKSWDSGKIFELSLSKSETSRFFKEYFKLEAVPSERISATGSVEVIGFMGSHLKLTGVLLLKYTKMSYTEDEKDIVQRFAKVLEQTYTRFLDLKKAEEQAREAQIEASLERVRAKAMAMHSSEDLTETVGQLFKELNSLDVSLIRCGVGRIYEDRQVDLYNFSLTNKAEPIPVLGKAILKGHPALNGAFQGWKKQEEYHVILKGQSLKKYYETIKADFRLPKQTDSLVQYGYFTYFSSGALYTYTNTKLTEDQLAIFRKFSSVVGLTYRRFLDLEEAEAQARETQIEAALERVRAKAMAMHNTGNLSKANGIMFDELKQLGITPLRSGIGLLNADTRDAKMYAAASSDEGNTLSLIGGITLDNHPVLDKIYRHWLKKEIYCSKLNSHELQEYYDIMLASYNDLPKPKFSKGEVQYGYFLPFTHGSFYAWTKEQYDEQELNITQRFVSVIDLTYKRYFDLQRAEEQVREAQIEASLERVRAKVIAMHNTDDLHEAINTVFVELKSLEVQTVRTGLAVIDEKSMTAKMFATAVDDKKVAVKITGTLDVNSHPMMRLNYDSWKAGEKERHDILEGKELVEYYKVLRAQFDVPDHEQVSRLHGFHFYFSHCILYCWSAEELTKGDMNIFQKFGTVVELTYQRYDDLKEAEARAQEAIVNSSLDRVRAEIASMRTTDDLERITPLVWKELTALGVPFFRCGIFIIDEASESINMYLTSPNGESLAALELGFDDSDIPMVTEAITHWKSQTVHKAHWTQDEFKGFSKSLQDRGLIQNLKTYQQGEQPPENLYLHQVPFRQGMLYVGSSESLPEAQIELVHSLADAFSVAYSRYEDFVQLEQAKSSVENTLTDLKSAQNQLVHSEKMASLGELTAGIAHEIQNPLNFVNNFSEINKELIEELKEELEAGNIEEVNAIAQDIIDNEEKVMHHGKRAEGIVKSMLAHSRTSSNTKEPTDINALADEYLRLAYHGLRAKDKSFNADFKADLAENLPKLTVVAQDIGRVLLNLINNAFQAVAGVDNPTVTVSTITNSPLEGGKGCVFISVKDNGSGIPDNIKEKIFEPFFTTKPTGEGTGLGLSMSYDIVTKGHGGKLEVKTQKGKGSEFIVELPVV